MSWQPQVPILLLSNIRHVPNDPKLMEKCEKVKYIPWRIQYVPVSLIKQKMCEKAAKGGPWYLKNLHDHFKTQEMCEKSNEKDSWRLYDVPDHLKTQKLCGMVVEKNPLCLEYVPHHFLRRNCL